MRNNHDCEFPVSGFKNTCNETPDCFEESGEKSEYFRNYIFFDTFVPMIFCQLLLQKNVSDYNIKL